jgi:long-chain acyl-CoA synthetase
MKRVSERYYRDPESTGELFTTDGYLKTGDVGYLDRENYLFLTGRKKSLIVTEGGKNVYPEEIEDHFQLFQEIEQILIKGYISNRETLAEGIESLIYTSDDFLQGWDAEEREIRIRKVVAEANRELLPYKRITKISLVEQPMEMTSTRKIKRNEVLQKLEDVHE